jgi:ribosome-binding factor A
MRSRFRKRPSAGQAGDDELVDRFFGEQARGVPAPIADRRLKQLCREVYRVLAQVPPGDTHDSVLSVVSVMSVAPAPDASRLAVHVHVGEGADAHEVVEHLQRVKGHLRWEIAAAIQRKRTPELVYRVEP